MKKDLAVRVAVLEAQREGDVALAQERDRRYAEVNIEREKALKIKETADLAALQLAREIQTYKDEKANELREQINRERGLYVTREELASAIREIQASIKPLEDLTTKQVGAGQQRVETRFNVNTLLQGVAVIIAAIVLYLAFHK